MLIDLHAHVLPREFPEARGEGWPSMQPTDPVDGDEARLLVAGKLRFTARDVFFDAERRLAAMDEAGVDAEVVSPMPPLLNYVLPAKDARDLCRWINEFIAGLCETDRRRFFGLGTVPLQDPDLAAEELSEIKRIGLAGIEIGSNIDGVSLGEERLLGFFQEAERLQVPIFVHAFNPTFADRVPAAALGTFAFMADNTLAAASLITSGTADKVPNLRLAFSHAAGGFPLVLPRAQYFWGGTWNEEPPADGRERAPISPSEYARRFYYDSLVFDRRAIRYLIDMLGSTQLLVGTDFPAMPREQPAGRTLRSLDLPQAVLDDITWNNAFRFLGIDPPPPKSM
ncbi:MAG: amidohydrolase family protein [Streptosporangiales bacterium]|nr:amidohydrolase family protein [Streptosporangiales bacterium]